jgi:hypothetical protein
VATRAARPPRDLAPEGRAVWRSIQDWLRESGLRLDPHEDVLLAEICRQVDRLASLRIALAETPTTDAGWVRMAGEERQGRVAYGRMLSQLGLATGSPDADGGENVIGFSTASRHGAKAARARWSRARPA